MTSPPPAKVGIRSAAPLLVAGALGLGGLAAAAVWALAPLETPDALRAALSPAAREGEIAAKSAPESPAEPVLPAPLDLAAFRAPLWIAPPPPPPPPPAPVVAAKEPEPPPPPPLKLQLLAIVRESDGSYRALVYDPDADTLLVLAEGQRLGTRTVESVSAAELRLREESRGRTAGAVRTLALRDDGAGATPATPSRGRGTR